MVPTPGYDQFGLSEIQTFIDRPINILDGKSRHPTDRQSLSFFASMTWQFQPSCLWMAPNLCCVRAAANNSNSAFCNFTLSVKKILQRLILLRRSGTGQPIVLIHGFLNGHSWEKHLSAAEWGISHYLRSPWIWQPSQPSFGYDYDTFAADLNVLMTSLTCKNVLVWLNGDR